MVNNFTKKLLSMLVLISTMMISACQPQATTNSTATLAPVANLTNDQIISIGILSNDPASEIASYQPLMDYLAKQMSDLGIRQGQVVVTPDFDTMDAKIKSGEVDLFYETAYGALYTHQHAGTVPLLRGWKGGLAQYHSTVFVRKDSGILSLDGLRGHLIAFAEPDSTSGFFLPKAFLISSGFNTIEETAAGSVPPDKIGYVSSGSDDNVVAYVLHGTAIGGALEYDTFDAIKQSDKDQLTVLAQTQDIPRAFLMASPTLSSAVSQRVISLLKGASQTPDGKAALDSAGGTKQFDDFPLGSSGTMQFIQNLFSPVQ